MAITISELPNTIKLCLVSLVTIGSSLQITAHRKPLTLTHRNRRWTVNRGPDRNSEAELVQAGYRHTWLVILVLQYPDTRYYRVPVWRDQLASECFSYLHFQLRYCAQVPIRRTLKGVLNSR